MRLLTKNRWTGRTCLLAALVLSFEQAASGISPGFVEAERPRLEALFAALGETEGLAEAQRARQQGDLVRAADLLLTYFAARPEPPATWLPPLTSDPGTAQRAEDARRGRFHLQGQVLDQPRRTDGGIDWEASPPNGDKEWVWQLNRHGYFRDLLAVADGNPAAPETVTLQDHLADWINTHPYPGGWSFSGAWRPLEVARRLRESWAYAFEAFRRHPEQHGETLLLMLSSVADHADALRHHASFWGGNHLLTEKAALYFVARYWPEFAASQEWQAHAYTAFAKALHEQVYPDGVHKELSNHYQYVVLRTATELLGLLPEGEGKEVRREVERMWEAFARVTRPDGTGPLNNGADIEPNAARVREVASRFGHPEWLAMATSGAEGVVPREVSPSFLLPWGGQAILRTSWDTDAQWAYLDLGPAGTAHAHDDALHVSLAWGARTIVDDSGRFEYQPGPWRDYFTGPRSHNVLLIDGQPPQPRPTEATRPLPPWHVDAARGWAWGQVTFGGSVWTGRPEAVQRRGVLQLPGRGWVIVDDVILFQPRSVEVRWNFHPAIAPEEAAELVRAFSAADSFRKVTKYGQEDPEIEGFYSAEYNERQPRATVVFSGLVQEPVTLIWFIAATPELAEGLEGLTVKRSGAETRKLGLTWKDGTRQEIEVTFGPDASGPPPR